MAKQIAFTIDDDLYEELVRRAGSQRKISKYLNPLIRNAFAQPETDLAARVATLEQEVARLRSRPIDRPAE
jgi:uncharacterized protein YceH (UPF0502 family)